MSVVKYYLHVNTQLSQAALQRSSVLTTP